MGLLYNPMEIGEAPFSLVYGAEAVIPAEVGMPSLRTEKLVRIRLPMMNKNKVT